VPTICCPQLQKPTGIRCRQRQANCDLILVGLFKKVFVADKLRAAGPITPSTRRRFLNGQWALLGVLAFGISSTATFPAH